MNGIASDSYHWDFIAIQQLHTTCFHRLEWDLLSHVHVPGGSA